MFLLTGLHHGVATTGIATARMTTRLVANAMRNVRADILTRALRSNSLGRKKKALTGLGPWTVGGGSSPGAGPSAGGPGGGPPGGDAGNGARYG